MKNQKYVIGFSSIALVMAIVEGPAVVERVRERMAATMDPPWLLPLVALLAVLMVFLAAILYKWISNRAGNTRGRM